MAFDFVSLSTREVGTVRSRPQTARAWRRGQRVAHLNQDRFPVRAFEAAGPGGFRSLFSLVDLVALRRYLFNVAQICNLLYRRFVIGGARASPNTLDFADAPQVTNLRYSPARQSRNQNELTTDEHG
jgi:hypothetical protein